MRALICLALLLPSPALADVIQAQSHVTAVTVFAQGAEVTREVAFTAPPGKHQIVIPGLPYFEDGSLRVSGADGTVGAISVRMTEDPQAATDAYIATEARLTAAREALWQAEASLAKVSRWWGKASDHEGQANHLRPAFLVAQR